MSEQKKKTKLNDNVELIAKRMNVKNEEKRWKRISSRQKIYFRRMW